MCRFTCSPNAYAGRLAKHGDDRSKQDSRPGILLPSAFPGSYRRVPPSWPDRAEVTHRPPTKPNCTTRMAYAVHVDAGLFSCRLRNGRSTR